MRTTGAVWIVFVAAAITWRTAAAADGAAALGPSRTELVHGWDLNKDGTIDEAEAEVARAKMRRARIELQQKAATEKPLVPGLEDNKPGRSFVKDDDPLKSLGPSKVESDPLGDAFRPPMPPAPKAEDETVREPPKRERELNAGRPKGDGSGIQNARSPRERTSTGGLVTGGVRAGAPALRPGYGATGPKVDLNAGRLPAGLPPAQGMRPQVGSAPFRRVVPGEGPARAGDRAAQPPRPPLMPVSPNRASAEDIGLP